MLLFIKEDQSQNENAALEILSTACFFLLYSSEKVASE